MPIISEPVLLSSPYRNDDSIEFVIDTDECLPDWMVSHQMLIFISMKLTVKILWTI